ncbi:Nephrocystin-3 [Tetrabaena socialis]|uniref:Nephrocystin-3 n=1 Tax=Tetrabaena socialis TaxID=47790 RepID=A0A2J7ZYT4_9CHLO|nr:Nephrocystin-3 [Tetrabaena socialis]|eukprot:PNH05427.1 Nephrocystin-3 [Tetrabaena socialis]
MEDPAKRNPSSNGTAPPPTCVFEVWRTEPSKLCVLHPTVERYRLYDILRGVDMAACEASSSDDLQRILTEINDSIGVRQLNLDVQRALLNACALPDPVAELAARASIDSGVGAPGDAAAGADAAAAGRRARTQGELLVRGGRYREAEPFLRAALELFYRACDGRPAGQAPLEDWAGGHHQLGSLLCLMGRYGEAEYLHRRALQLRERGAPGPDASLVASSLHNLADVLAEAAKARGRRRLGELEGRGERGTAGSAGVPGSGEAGAAEVAEVASSGAGPEELRPPAPAPAGDMLREAEALYRRCLEVRRGLHGESHPATARTQAGLARALILLREMGAAAASSANTTTSSTTAPTSQQQQQQQEQQGQQQHDCRHDQHQQHQQPERPDEAGMLARAALEAQEREFGPQHPEVALSLHVLAAWHELHGQLAEAEVLRRRALGIQRVCLGAGHPLVASGGVALARVLLAKSEGAGADVPGAAVRAGSESGGDAGADGGCRDPGVSTEAGLAVEGGWATRTPPQGVGGEGADEGKGWVAEARELLGAAVEAFEARLVPEALCLLYARDLATVAAARA